MADEKVYSNGNIDVVVLPANGLAKPAAPLATEVNAGVNISNALAWDSTTIPAMAESNDIDDRSIKDGGNASSRGFAQYEGAFNLFMPPNREDLSDDFGKAYAFFRKPRFVFWAVVKILQGTEGKVEPFAAGQMVSVYKFIADTFVYDTEGEDSYKYTVDLLQQGAAYPNTILGPVAAPTVVNASGAGSLAVGAHAVLRATLGTHRATQLVKWTSSNPSVASVTQNGVVTALKAGTASITANHPAATAPSTAVAITVA